MKNKNVNGKESMSHKAGDAVERAGEKISRAGAERLGRSISNAGDKLEHSGEKKSAYNNDAYAGKPQK